MTRQETCILKVLPEKALQENSNLNEFILESRNEWKQKWLVKDLSEEFLKTNVNIFGNSKFSKYGWNFKTKLFSSLYEKDQFQKKKPIELRKKITIEELKKLTS